MVIKGIFMKLLNESECQKVSAGSGPSNWFYDFGKTISKTYKFVSEKIANRKCGWTNSGYICRF